MAVFMNPHRPEKKSSILAAQNFLESFFNFFVLLILFLSDSWRLEKFLLLLDLTSGGTSTPTKKMAENLLVLKPLIGQKAEIWEGPSKTLIFRDYFLQE